MSSLLMRILKCICILLFISKIINCYEEDLYEYPELDYSTADSNETFTPDLLSFYDEIAETNEDSLDVENTTETLTDSFCIQHPELKTLTITSGILVEIEENALKNCKDLVTFNANNNEISGIISFRTFLFNTKLESIWLADNQITSIENGTFNHLKELNIIDLSRNFLKMFSSSLIFGLKKLRILSLYSNKIIELDVQAIIDNASNLEYLYFNDNSINCTRVSEIKQILQKRGFHMDDISPINLRNFNTTVKEELTCVEDSEWAKLFGTPLELNDNTNRIESIYDDEYPSYTISDANSVDLKMLKLISIFIPIIVTKLN